MEPRNILITGAAAGMGAAAVRQALSRGDVNVVAVDMNADGLSSLVETVGATHADRLHTIQGDVNDPTAVESFVSAAVSRWNGLDGLFNIAGIAQSKSILDLSVEDYDRTMNINARGAWLSMKFVLPTFLERGGGRIVNTGSRLATHGGANFAHYAASKHALVGMTKSVALEYAAHNIVANVVCPAGMDTDMIWEAFRSINPDDPESARDTMLAGLPQRRLAQPDEVAATGLWLLLDAPWHLNGQVISVDGGAQAG